MSRASAPQSFLPHPLGRGRTPILRCRLRADNSTRRWAAARRGSSGEVQLARRASSKKRPVAETSTCKQPLAESNVGQFRQLRRPASDRQSRMQRPPLRPAIAEAPPLPESVDLVLASSPCAKVGSCCIDTADAGSINAPIGLNKCACVDGFGSPLVEG